MSSLKDLNNDNYLKYAADHYDNNNCEDIEEFYADLATIKYLKKLISKYKSSGILKEQLIINHLVYFLQLFPGESGLRILFLRIRYEDMDVLKPFLVYLQRCPKTIPSINGQDVKTSEIEMNDDVVMRLRQYITSQKNA